MARKVCLNQLATGLLLSVVTLCVRVRMQAFRESHLVRTARQAFWLTLSVLWYTAGTDTPYTVPLWLSEVVSAPPTVGRLVSVSDRDPGSPCLVFRLLGNADSGRKAGHGGHWPVGRFHVPATARVSRSSRQIMDRRETCHFVPQETPRPTGPRKLLILHAQRCLRDGCSLQKPRSRLHPSLV